MSIKKYIECPYCRKRLAIEIPDTSLLEDILDSVGLKKSPSTKETDPR